MEIYILDGEKKLGPHTEKEIRSMLRDGEISRQHLGWRVGLRDWLPLDQIISVKSLSPLPPIPTELPPIPNNQPPLRDKSDDFAESFSVRNFMPLVACILGMGWLMAMLVGFDRHIGEHSWLAVGLLAVPAVYMSGVVMLYFLRPLSFSLRSAMGALAFTMVCGLALLLTLQGVATYALNSHTQYAGKATPLLWLIKFIGYSYRNISDPSYAVNLWARLEGFIFAVGPCEEFTKLLPLFFILLINRGVPLAQRVSYRSFLGIGFFSGMGFGIGEALYSYAPWTGNTSMGSNVLRWFALVPSHGAWTTLAAVCLWLLAPKIQAATKKIQIFCWLGLSIALAAVTHGIYDVLCGVNAFAAILIEAVSLLFLYIAVRMVSRKITRNIHHYEGLVAPGKLLAHMSVYERGISPLIGLFAVCAMATFLVAGCFSSGSGGQSKNTDNRPPTTDNRPPTRKIFNKRLMSVTMHSNKGSINLIDSNGEELVMEVRPKDNSYDLVTAVKKYDYYLQDKDKEPRLMLGDYVINESSDELKVAIETMIDWSISQAENQVLSLKRDISSGRKNSYKFRGDLKTNTFELSEWKNLLDEGNFNQSIYILNATGHSGAQTVITTFNRVHLWKYIFDHYKEVIAAADADFSVQNAKRLKDEQNQEKKRQEDQKRKEAIKAGALRAQRDEQERMEKLFPRTNKPGAEEPVIKDTNPTMPHRLDLPPTPAPTPQPSPKLSVTPGGEEPLKKDVNPMPPPRLDAPPTRAQPPQPSPKLSVAPGDEILITRGEMMFFKDKPQREAIVGEKFVVVEQRPDSGKVFVLAKNQTGQDVALSISDTAVGAAPVDIAGLLKSAIKASEINNIAAMEQLLSRANRAAPNEPSIRLIRKASQELANAQAALQQVRQSLATTHVKASQLVRNAQTVDRPNPLDSRDTSNQQRAQGMRDEANQMEEDATKGLRSAEKRVKLSKSALLDIILPSER